VPDTIYQDWFDAILQKQRVAYTYKGEQREGCPHVLGLDGNGAEKVLIFRLAPGRGPLPLWRCLFLTETAGVLPVEGPWLEGDSHKVRNSCIVTVHIDVNRAAAQLFDWKSMKMPRRRSSAKKPSARSATKNKKPRTR
jgi:hypothetical protein